MVLRYTFFMNQFKAVLFDMDGTLIDARDWHKQALNDALGIFGFAISDNLHKEKLDGLSTNKKLDYLTSNFAFPRELHSMIFDIKQDRTLRIAAQNCYPIVSVQILLKRLELLGIRMGVVTNSIRETSETMLKYGGIYKYFEFVVTNEDVINPKPNPEGYNLACKNLKLNPSEILVVEDGIYGIQAAELAGIHNVIKVDNPSHLNIELLLPYFELLNG